MKIRIWPVLLLGFSILVVLIAFAGLSALRRATGSYAGTTRLYAEELRTEQVLGRLRSDILSSAIAVRDLLLVPADDSGEKMAELNRLRTSSHTSLQALDTLIPSEYRERIQRLTREVDDYWSLLEPPPPASGATPSRLSEAILRERILPRRQAVLTLAEQIEALTRDSIRKRREDIDRRQADLPFYVSEIVGGTLLVGLLVASTSLIRISQLEATAASQHRIVVDAEEELRHLSQQLVRTQEEERRSLSRDLHDQIGQVLTAVRIGIGNLEEALQSPEGHAEARTQLEQAKRLSEQALRSVRDIAMGLRPAMLDDLGLGAALEWHARQFSKLCDVPVSIAVQGDIEQLSDAHRTCIYRLVQEALNNAAKHARASEIGILMVSNDSGIRIEVRDNGIGFDARGRRTTGLGLIGIKERVRQLNGDTTVESKPGQGTALLVWLPRGPVTE
ncbi:MAG: sensor histidine kinase [Terriglobia bacterium]